uniref:Uncharacterized protein n=1 Tax=Manihot esculenta TaxID=3983 RepID=A0A2C9UL71_MANES
MHEDPDSWLLAKVDSCRPTHGSLFNITWPLSLSSLQCQVSSSNLGCYNLLISNCLLFIARLFFLIIIN